MLMLQCKGLKSQRGQEKVLEKKILIYIMQIALNVTQQITVSSPIGGLIHKINFQSSRDLNLR